MVISDQYIIPQKCWKSKLLTQMISRKISDGRKSDEMSQGVCVMEAADASGSTADSFLEVYQGRAINVHEVIHYGTEQKIDEQVMVQ